MLEEKYRYPNLIVLADRQSMYYTTNPPKAHVKPLSPRRRPRIVTRQTVQGEMK
jgi:hypothetical protein